MRRKPQPPHSGHGHGLKPSRVILVGATDLDTGEAELLRKHGVHTIVASEATPEAILQALDGAPFWVHIDWDALEPGFVPAAYSVPGGLFPKQLETILTSLPPAAIVGIELAEFEAGDNPSGQKCPFHDLSNTGTSAFEVTNGFAAVY